jgi:hypothetical protein
MSDSSFLTLVKSVFSYLPPLGFQMVGGEENDLYAKVEFRGTHVVIMLSRDKKEEVYDCYVGKIVDGEIQVMRGVGGYWSPLRKYLIDFVGYRGGVEIEAGLADQEPRQVYEYDALLKKFGKKLVADSADAFDK